METIRNYNKGDFMQENTALQLRDNAQQMLMNIKTLEGGVEYLNKVRAIEVWAKAEKKDAELQNMIAEQKIRTQRVLGRLIKEGQERGELRKRNDNQYNASDKKELADIGVTKKQSSVYQKIADIPEDKFEAHIAEKKQNIEAAVNELTTAGMLHFANTGAHVSNNSGDNEWFTPKEYIDAVKAVMGSIDLDPASCQIANTVVQAAKYYTILDDGLNKDWIGNVFLNPPYAQPLIDNFSNKLISEITSQNINQAIVLVNNATETKWFQLLASKSSAICFPKSRIKFWSPVKESAPLQGQAFLYFGSEIEKFINGFGKYGFVAVIR
ncbi:MAG: DNA N-6-adenine-methyltransferase [Veillonellales bacterium]